MALAPSCICLPGDVVLHWIYISFLERYLLSFCKFVTIGDASFVGFRNYMDAFNDASFIHAFWYTALYAIVSLFIINVLAFLIAYLLTLGIKGTNLFRTAFLCLTL